jgi:hypothetical protein
MSATDNVAVIENFVSSWLCYPFIVVVSHLIFSSISTKGFFYYNGQTTAGHFSLALYTFIFYQWQLFLVGIEMSGGYMSHTL